MPIIKNIQKELLLICSELQTDDTLIVAFSGHGIQFKNTSDAYFCPADARLNDKATLLSLTRVYDLLGDVKVCKATNKILLVDACRNDPQSRVSKAAKEIELEPAGIKERPTPPGGIAAFYSCSQGQKSFEHPDLQHGVFVNFIIEAFQGKGDLDGDGEISLAELEQYSVKATQKYARTVFGQAQTPERKGETRGLVTVAAFSQTPPGSQTLISKTTGMDFVLIPAGTFMMGSPETEKDYQTDESQHRVTISQPFITGKNEVTVGQFRKFVTDQNYRTEAESDGKGGYGIDATGNFSQDPKYTWKNPGFTQADTHPVVNVSWNDAHKFIAWQSQKDGRSYRLPTEAEWECACRGGSTTTFWMGTDAEGLATVGNIADAAAKRKFSVWSGSISADDGFVFTAPVGSFRANRFGLFDMHGNVWEWCADWYDSDYYGTSPGSDPPGPTAGSYRVDRGGGWSSFAWRCRSAYRNLSTPDDRRSHLGFRLAAGR